VISAACAATLTAASNGSARIENLCFMRDPLMTIEQ
jgi:hypothetical protein